MNSPRSSLWRGPAISIEDLSFAYRGGEANALAGINVQLRDGQFAVIMGHGGAGKSTFCYCLNALIPRFFKGSYQGRALVKGIEVGTSRVYDMSRLVGLVFQDFESQLFSTNVELEVAFGPENYGVPREEIQRRIDKVLAFVRLAELRHREPASLSGGQKQRLAIASILAMEPEVLVMDEPTTDLDPIGRDEVLAVSDELARQGRTLLIVDHEPETARDADLLFLMKEGHLVRQGPPREVLTDVPLTLECGVMPPQVVELFHTLDWPESPWDVEEALYLFREAPLRLRPKAQDLLRGIDAARTREVRDEIVLETRGLGYVYEEGNVEALRDVDLQIRAGEFVAIIGQNGSGKTTLAKQFNGLLHPTTGEILVDGATIHSLSRAALSHGVGYVFQNPDHQIFASTVREEVAFGPRNFGMDEAKIEERVAEALRVVGLEGYEERDPFALTKGERQRVAVASVLATRPRVVILDEPTTGLDYPQQRRMMEMLDALNRMGHTVMIITHSMWVVAEYATRTVVMRDGRVIRDGPTREVFADEETLAEAFLKPPPIVRLAHRLGVTALTVDEMVEVVER